MSHPLVNGGKVKAVERFCSITKYIKHVNPDLYELLDNLCLLKSLEPRASGITFIFPSEETIARYHKDYDKDALESIASNFNAHIIYEHIKEPRDWNGADIANAHRRRITATFRDGKVVITSAGKEVVIVPDKRFRAFSANPRYEPNQTVYTIVSGSIEYDPSAELLLKTKKRARVTGGGIDRTYQKTFSRRNFVLEAIVDHISQCINSGGKSYNSPLIECLVHFYNWMCHKDSELAKGLLNLLSPCVVTSFLIVFYDQKNPFVKDSYIEEWFRKYRFPIPNAVATYKNLLSSRVNADVKLPEQDFSSLSKGTISQHTAHVYGEFAHRLGVTPDRLMLWDMLKFYEIMMFHEKETQVQMLSKSDLAIPVTNSDMLRDARAMCAMIDEGKVFDRSVMKYLDKAYFETFVMPWAMSDMCPYNPFKEVNPGDKYPDNPMEDPPIYMGYMTRMLDQLYSNADFSLNEVSDELFTTLLNNSSAEELNKLKAKIEELEKNRSS